MWQCDSINLEAATLIVAQKTSKAWQRHLDICGLLRLLKSQWLQHFHLALNPSRHILSLSMAFSIKVSKRSLISVMSGEHSTFLQRSSNLWTQASYGQSVYFFRPRVSRHEDISPPGL